MHHRLTRTTTLPQSGRVRIRRQHSAICQLVDARRHPKKGASNREFERRAAPQLRREYLQPTRGLTTENYAEQANFLATPGAPLRILPAARFTPWVSFGAGVGRLNRAGSLSTPTGSGTLAVAGQTGDRNVFVISTAGGVDWKPVRFFFVRGEVRNYTFTTPRTAFVGSDAFVGERRNNLMFLGGIGVRF